MRKNCWATLLAAVCVAGSLASCIRDEASNAECDITGVDSVWTKAHAELLSGNPIVKNEAVLFYYKPGTEADLLTSLDPRFYITPRATLTPQSGTARDFTTPQTYRTVSEDGHWSKIYTVSFVEAQPLSFCSFEHARYNNAKQQYQEFYEVAADGQTVLSYWDSGNAGFAFAAGGKPASDYPTTASASGYKGQCAKLTTCSTGAFGQGVNMPIAAGNLFIGEFQASQALMAPRKATKFGLPLAYDQPRYLEGYYRYTAGKTMTDKDQNVLPDRKDTCDIYAVLYEIDPAHFEPLNGDNVLTSSRIVSLARIDDPGEPQEWRHFVEPFRLRQGKSFDESRAKRGGYAIAIVMTSSRQGAYFEGAVGSTLYVDELRIVWDSDPDKGDYSRYESLPKEN